MGQDEPIHVPGEVIPPGGSPKTTTKLTSPQPPIGQALLVAVIADLTQLVLFPLFLPGALSPLNDGLDIVVFITMVRLLGWHWAFLPSFFAELVPGLDALPCWTLAVLAIRAQQRELRDKAAKEGS